LILTYFVLLFPILYPSFPTVFRDIALGMDPYSAKRHALYQPRGPTEYEVDYPTSSDAHPIQTIDELQTSWYGGVLGIDVPETTHESNEGNISFLPATQPAKRIRIEPEETLIPIELRTEVFALLSGASLDDFLEIRHFLQRPSQASSRLTSKLMYAHQVE
jgi:hypothetical protein